MKKDTDILKFRTKWLHHTVKVLKTSCENYHTNTRQLIEEMAAIKAGAK
ncbi:hypothetical protein [Terasakiella pusilla]|jgi:hypothetical protein|nr:hypothetical protein [Terasakiella pusilla]